MIRDTAQQDRTLARPDRRPMRRLTLWVLAGVALIAAAGFAVRAWLASERSIDASRVRIATVTRGTLVRDISAEGRVIAANSPTLYAIAAGTVTLAVVAGDAVVRDQALATIASPELESRLAQEQASVAALEAEVGRGAIDVEQGVADARKLVDQGEIDLQTATREVQSNQSAYDAGAIPEIDLLRAQDALKKAEIALSHAHTDGKLQQQALGFDLKTKRLALDRQRSVVQELSRQVGALVIRSPVDGQIGQVLIAQRANVAADAPLLTVIDLSAFELQIKVPDSFARDLAIGMPAEITAAGKRFTGRVHSVSPEVVNGEVASHLEFVGDKPAGLRQNQRLSARILLDERPDVLMVERGPFLEDGGGSVAYVVVDGVAERRTIRAGVSSLEAVEILSGASAGDRIVVSGTDTFDGAERIRLAD